MRKTGYAVVGNVLHALIIDEGDAIATPQHYPREHLPSYFDFTEKGIVKFVNALLGTNFSDFGYSTQRVHETTDCLC